MELVKELLLGIAISCWIFWLWRRYEFYKFALKVPCVWGLPLVGVIFHIGSINNVISFIANQIKIQKYRTFCVWMAVTPFLFTVDPDVIEQVLTSTELVEKSRSFYTPMKDAVHGGLISLPVKSWHFNRKIVAPIFRPKQLLHFIPVFNRRSKEFLNVLEGMSASGKPQKILKELQACALSISMETTMDLTGDRDMESLRRMLNALEYMFKNVGYQAFLNCAHLRFLINYLPKFLFKKQILFSFGDELTKLSAKRFLPDADQTEPMSPTDIKKKSYIFIEQALKHYRAGDLKWEEVVGELNGLLIVSFETSSNALFNVLCLLAMHPDIQEKLFEELKDTFPDKDFTVKYEDFPNLVYLEMVINETIRLYPPGPIIGRHITNTTTTLEINGSSHLLPKDMQILIPLYHLHRDPKVFGPDPEAFNPDHFLPQNMTDWHPYQYIPFSKGPRNCIGWNYGYYSMKVILSQILRNYKIVTDFKYENYKMNLTILLEIKTEPFLRFERRE